VGQCLDWLGQFGKAQMTGSGSAAFIKVENDRAGQDVINALPEDLSGWVAHGINQNPSFAEEPVGV
jgi:4-diphosphocytidyl-2-C-methyl-D-erythritol kinase